METTRPLAVLTGASSGIGAALAPLLARDGYDLILVARREDRLKGLAERIAREHAGARAEAFPLDVTAEGAAKRLVERAPAARLLVNSAGFGHVGPALSGHIEKDLDEYRRMIALNVGALTETTLRFADRMAASGGGTIFNIASTAGLAPIPYFSVYAATKAYVISFSEGLHFEMRPRGVHVLAYCPGPTETEFAGTAGATSEQLAKGRKFFLSPERVAERAARAIRRREERAIPGALNRALAFAQRHSPWRVVRWFGATAFRPPGVK